MQSVEVGYSDLTPTEVGTRRGILNKLESRKLMVVLVTFALAFGARVYRLDAAGFSEDETNKLFAIRAYRQGDFTANAEHPMMLKMLCYCSVTTSGWFNSIVGSRIGRVISEETALRLPNALFGALTVIPLFLLTAALFGFRIGLITGLLWAIGLNAIWINRIVKEDSLLVFFMLTGFYLYNCAKERPASDISGQERLYAFTGAAFGLMLASKYFPHYFGLAVLFYHLAGYDSRNNRPRTRRMNAAMFAAMILAFVAFNPAVFVPQTWRYLTHFVSADLITHHGYLVMGSLFHNDMPSMPFGSPWYFYFVFLATKVPLPLLALFLVGLIEIFRHRGPEGMTRGYLFLRIMLFFWLVPMAIVSSKFLRYTLSLMPLVYITAAIGVVVVGKGLSSILERLIHRPFIHRRVIEAAIAILLLATSARTLLSNMPYPSLYLNPLGGNRIGFFFPHDEFYDLGARESIKYLAENAPPRSTVASEIPGVLQYYLEKYNRPDIRSEIMSHPKFSLDRSRANYALLQPGRVYFENRQNVQRIESNYKVVQASAYRGADAIRVYEIGNGARER